MVLKASDVPEVPYRAGHGTPLFTIGSFEFQLYSLMIMLGILASVLTITFFWNRQKYKTEVFLMLIIITVPMSILGARLGYVFEVLIYETNPFVNSAWYAAWDGGLSIQGGIILAAVCDLAYAYSKRDVIDIRKGMSFIIPTILVGQFVGRWGNYANHEVYGKIDWTGASSLIFGKSFAQHMFIVDSYSEQLLGPGQGAFRFPLFLYEGLLNILGYFLIVWVFNLFGIFKPGSTAGLYLIWYGIVRLGMEPMRQEAFGYYVYLALIFTILGALMFIYYQFLSRVEYIKIRKKYYFDYEYKNPEAYAQWVERTKIWKAIKNFYREKDVLKTLKKSD